VALVVHSAHPGLADVVQEHRPGERCRGRRAGQAALVRRREQGLAPQLAHDRNGPGQRLERVVEDIQMVVRVLQAVLHRPHLGQNHVQRAKFVEQTHGPVRPGQAQEHGELVSVPLRAAGA